jgi:D-psicose/D-tagatose/L-ribulose 3-epimerase
MRFGVNTWVWTSPLTTNELKRLASTVKEMGFDWIELPIEGLNDFDYTAAGQIIRDHGLGVSLCAAMGPDRDLIHEDSALRENGAAYLHADERARDVDTLVGQLSVLAQYAANNGAVLCIEPLTRFETSFINTADQAIEVIDRVNRPTCKIMLDTFHMNIEEKSLGAAIRKTGARLAHFHACENDRGAPGSGNVTWHDVATALHEIGYDGPVVIESFTDKVKSIARAAAIWRAFEPSQDMLAQNGLNFLKQLLAG